MLPIDRLKPGSVLHGKVLQYLLERLNFSENKMKMFYSRWTLAESRIQAYIDLPDYEKTLKAMTESKEPPKAVSIIVPYSYATISTMCTYHIQTFAGRRPIFQVTANKSEAVVAAGHMETVLQYNADHARFISKLWQFLWDSQTYGVGVLRTAWKNEKAMRTVWRDRTSGMGISLGQVRTREMRTVFSGNEVENIDPYMFFPDPRVPMVAVNKKGEFVFWRSFIGKHEAKTLEAAGEVKYINNVGRSAPKGADSGNSDRGLLSGGSSAGGRDLFSGSGADHAHVQDFIQWDQGSVVIIPKELGLGDSEVPQKWLFTIGNKRQITQAEPLMLDHDMHPVCITEPQTLGYGFGQPAIADYIAPLQDTMSWYINSHIHNVRGALNNMFVYDPSRIEKQDIQRPGPGKLIRVKPAGYGQDIRQMVSQLTTMDVTATHTRDFEMFMKMADMMTGVGDNVRGVQDSGGRKTATEVRTAGEAGASRLAAQSRLISAQALVDLAMQMTINIQQFMDEELYLAVVGEEGRAEPLRILPEHLVGDFQFPVNDGTLPIDRVAMLDVWKELFLGVSQNPQLGARYDAGKIFEFTAELGGAKNLKQFELKPGQQQPGVPLQGQVMPPGGEPPKGAVPIPMQRGSTTPGIGGIPSQRAVA